MRALTTSLLGIACACVPIAGATAQEGQKARISASLTRQDQIGLVNSVLKEREQLIGQPVIVDACALSLLFDDRIENLTPHLLPEFRGRVRGKPFEQCADSRDPGSKELKPRRRRIREYPSREGRIHSPTRSAFFAAR